MTLDASLFASGQIQIILLLIVADIVLGIIAALIKKDFALGNLATFMGKGIIPYLFGFAVVQTVGAAQPAYSFIVPVVFVLVVAALVGSILNNLDGLGVKLPKILKKA